MFCAPIAFLQHFENMKPEGCFAPPPNIAVWGTQPPGLMFLKYCENFISVQTCLHILGCTAYILNREVDAFQANLLKKALLFAQTFKGKSFYLWFAVCR